MDKKSLKFDVEKLIEKAVAAKNFAYVPYSNFRVGAALLTVDGEIITGCNIENAAYSPTNCAERTAFFKAVSEGKRDFAAIAISGGDNNKTGVHCPPCGVCRQVMKEFCNSDFIVILANSVTDYKILSLEELLPYSFDNKNL